MILHARSREDFSDTGKGGHSGQQGGGGGQGRTWGQQGGGGGQGRPPQGQPPGPAGGPGGPPQHHRGGRGSEYKTPITEKIPWKYAIAAGLVAFVAGMILQIGLLAIDGALDDDDEDEFDFEDDTDISILSVLGWWHFSAHFVDIEVSSPVGSESINVVSEADTNVPKILYRLLPVAMLIGAGLWLARREIEDGNQALSAPALGATVAVGYCLAVFFGVLLFEESIGVGSVSVPFVEALLIAGLIYPAIFGAVGGYLAEEYATSES